MFTRFSEADFGDFALSLRPALLQPHLFLGQIAFFDTKFFVYGMLSTVHAPNVSTFVCSRCHYFFRLVFPPLRSYF